MAADFVLATVLASLAPSAAVIDYTTPRTEVDVAFEELRAGDTAAAIRRLEDSRDTNADDPARLINLGSAYAREGRDAEAAEMYRAALDSDQHHWLELADGSWIDSRKAAQLALARLANRDSVAMR